MTKEELLTLNQTTLVPLAKATLYPEEGVRFIDCLVFPSDKLIIIGKSSDGRVLWFSTSSINEHETNKDIFNIIIDTSKSPTKEWHLVRLSDLIKKLKIDYNEFEAAYDLSCIINPNNLIDFKKQELTNLDFNDLGTYLENQLQEIFKETQDKCHEFENKPNCCEVFNGLRKKLLVNGDLNTEGLLNQYHQCKEAIDTLNNMDYLKLSLEANIRDTYLTVLRSAQYLYNRYMDIAR